MNKTSSHLTPDGDLHRLRALVDKYGRRYPDAWRAVDNFRAGRGVDLPTWPQWCFLPLAGAVAIVHKTGGLSLSRASDIGALGALAAWRVTQGVYRFDPAVYDAVRETPLADDIPCDVLFRLPEWCVYVETPGLAFGGTAMRGAFAHLEFDVNTERHELRVVLDCESGLVAVPLHLGAWPLAEAVERAVREGSRVMSARGVPEVTEIFETAIALGVTDNIAQALTPLVSLLLYLCATASEVGDGTRKPVNPQPKFVRGVPRIFQAERATTWEVGVRMGAALRRAYAAEQTGMGQVHGGPRPHVRRAHWHGFWSGSHHGQRRFDLRWLPPIAVNLSDPRELATVVRRVDAEPR